LNAQGFEMKLTGKHWTIKMRGDSRVTRLYQLGEQYTGESLQKRICTRDKQLVFYEKPKTTIQKYTFKGNFRQVKKLTGFRALYFHYLYLMGKLPRNKPRPPRHPILWEDVRKIERYSAQITLLCVHKIDTSAQLQAFVESTKTKMDALVRQRTDLQNKLRRAADPDAVAAMREEKAHVTAQIQPLRKDLKLCDGIAENTARMKSRAAMIRRLELEDKQKLQQKQQQKSKWRGRAR
jgi:hypothetical protein